MQVIYIDILFVINFIMDGMIFFVANNMLGKRIGWKKIIIGSLIAAIGYCLSIYIPTLQQLPIYIYYFFIPVIPILYIFNPHTIKEFLKVFLVCTISAFVIGGGSFNFYYLLIQLEYSKEIITFLPLVVGGLICIVTTLSFKWLRKRIILPSFEYEVTLYHLNKQESMMGIVDTGNCLYTILGKKPVTVVEYESIETLLSDKEKAVLEECYRFGIIETFSKQQLVGQSIYLIPFRSIGCKEGVLIGIEMEKIIITKGNRARTLDHSIVGICLEPIFDKYKYQALIHPELVIN